MNATAQQFDSTPVSAYDGGISSATVTEIGWTLGRHAQYTCATALVHAVNCHKVTGGIWLQGEPQLKPGSCQHKTKRKEKQKLELQTARRGSAFQLYRKKKLRKKKKARILLTANNAREASIFARLSCKAYDGPDEEKSNESSALRTSARANVLCS